MKIVLSAFGGMMSKVMDIPENSSHEWDMVLTQPMQALYRDTHVETRVPFHTRCRFEWNGKYINDARLYILTDIYKI